MEDERPPEDLAMDCCADGDPSAFAVVFKAIAPRLRRQLVRRVGEASAVDDLLQETMLRMHLARGTYIAGAAVWPWAVTIARNLTIDLFRRSGRSAVQWCSDETETEQMFGLSSRSDAPDARLSFDRVVERLTAELAALPRIQREAFELVVQDGLTYEAAAEILGITMPAMKVRVHRAREALRVVFEKVRRR